MTTTLQCRILKMLTAAADAGEPCPTNAEVSREMGLGDDRNGSEMIATLERRGVIFVERMTTGRRISIVSTGAMTGWRLGHADQRAYRVIDEGYRGPVPLHLMVDRDPCERCGVRADVGCEHARARLGTRMGL